LFITGLTGIRPQKDNSIFIDTLVPENSWDWFYIDDLNNKGKSVAIFYDKDGKSTIEEPDFLSL
jgi:hypothetical protein